MNYQKSKISATLVTTLVDIKKRIYPIPLQPSTYDEGNQNVLISIVIPTLILSQLYITNN